MESPGARPERVGAVIAAAGLSRRMGGADKLLAEVDGRPLLGLTIAQFQEAEEVDAIVLAVRQDMVEEWRLRAKVEGWDKVSAVVAGGARRQDSVLAGLLALGACDWVLVHDGARPCVQNDLFRRGLAAARETGAAIPAVPPKDTIKLVDAGFVVESTVPRDRAWLVQTPQVFAYDILRKAYRPFQGDVTDDASLVEQMGYRVKVFMGDYANIKVTTPEDLEMVRAFLLKRRGQPLGPEESAR